MLNIIFQIVLHLVSLINKTSNIKIDRTSSFFFTNEKGLAYKTQDVQNIKQNKTRLHWSSSNQCERHSEYLDAVKKRKCVWKYQKVAQ